MKRALYSIPLMGLGVTMVGCQDPIVGDFNVAFFEGTGLPVNYTQTDPQTGILCTTALSGVMTIDGELRATITVDYAYTCDDASLNESYTYTYTAAVEVIESGFAYKFTIADDTPIELDCSMSLQGVLFCNDVNNEAFVFEPR